jgi:hypothetical protein
MWFWEIFFKETQTMIGVDKLVDGLIAKLFDLFEKAEKNRDRELCAKAMLRAYYIEMLGTLKKDTLRESEINSLAFAATVNRLETRIAELILIDDEAARENGLYQFLQSTDSAGDPRKALPTKTCLRRFPSR